MLKLNTYIHIAPKALLPLRCGRQVGHEFGRSLVWHRLPLYVLKEDVILKSGVATHLITTKTLGGVQYLQRGGRREGERGRKRERENERVREIERERGRG